MADFRDMFPELGDRDVHGLRTFRVENDRLNPIIRGHEDEDKDTNVWEAGVCYAQCRMHPDDPEHEVPGDGCGCGVYAFLTVQEVLEQYGQWAHELICVVRFRGKILEGHVGWRAASAEIVGYWTSNERIAKVCRRMMPDVKRWGDRDLMAEIFEVFHEDDDDEED